MVKVSEIDSQGKLREWLEGLPEKVSEERARQIAVTIAFRAAARVFPLAVRGMPTENEADSKGDLSSLTVYRCLMISSFAALVPNEDIALLATAHASARTAADDTADATADTATYASARAAVASAEAVSRTASASAVAHASATAYAYAADAAVACSPITSFVSTAASVAAVADASALESGESLGAAPIWLYQAPLGDIWAEARAKLEAAPDDWSPVIAWYEHLLDPKGRALPVGMLRDIANGRDSVTRNVIDWEGGPLKALPVIGEIWGRHMGGGDRSFEDQVREMPKPNPSQVALTKQAVVEHRTELPPTIACVQEFILLEIERLQQSNQLNAEMPEMCRSMVGSLVTMHEALDRIEALVPEGDALSDADAEEIVSLGKLYKDKLLALPRDKADELVAKVWETGGNVVDLGLVAGSSGLLLMMGFPPFASVALGAMAFGRKNAGQIIDAAKEYLKRSAN